MLGYEINPDVKLSGRVDYHILFCSVTPLSILHHNLCSFCSLLSLWSFIMSVIKCALFPIPRILIPPRTRRCHVYSRGSSFLSGHMSPAKPVHTLVGSVLSSVLLCYVLLHSSSHLSVSYKSSVPSSSTNRLHPQNLLPQLDCIGLDLVLAIPISFKLQLTSYLLLWFLQSHYPVVPLNSQRHSLLDPHQGHNPVRRGLVSPGSGFLVLNKFYTLHLICWEAQALGVRLGYSNCDHW